MAIGFARFGRHRDQPLALATLLPAFGPLAYVSQVFQAHQPVGMGLQKVLADQVVRAQLKPSRALRWRCVAGSAATCLCAGAVSGHGWNGRL